MGQITSFIRWAGGKSWLVPHVKRLVDGLKFNNYYEPFMGGASIYFAIDAPNLSVLSDVNAELINTFCAVRDNPERIINYLKGYKSDEESYYYIRDLEPSDNYEKAAIFLYLNANSYNGLYRVNRKGKYNVPYGHRNATVNYEKLIQVSEKLKSAEIICQDFEAIKPRISNGDLVFLDPPYTVSMKNNGFIEYNSTLFSLEDQHRIASLVDHIQSVGAYFILTNAYHKTIEGIFKDKGRIETMERNSLIGGKHSYRGKVKEFLFTNIAERCKCNG